MWLMLTFVVGLFLETEPEQGKARGWQLSKSASGTVVNNAGFLPFEEAATDDLDGLPLGAMLCDQLRGREGRGVARSFALVKISSLASALNFGERSHAKSRSASTLHVQWRAYRQSARSIELVAWIVGKDLPGSAWICPQVSVAPRGTYSPQLQERGFVNAIAGTWGRAK